MIHSKGLVKIGGSLKKSTNNGYKSIVFNPKVIKVKKGKAFEWRDSLFIIGLFDGYRYFHIQKSDANQAYLIHRKKVSGIISGILFRKINEDTRNNFIKRNRALKSLVESQTQST